VLSTTSPNFKKELKAARIAKGLSGAELCRMIDISEGMMARYESETRTDRVLPNPETLQKINEVLFSKAPGTQQQTEAPQRSEQEIANSLPLPVLINAIRRHGGDVIFKAS
jgi:transcriptional regulator with XRE-family HTH domain